MVEHAARRIWKEYREDVPIVVRVDSGKGQACFPILMFLFAFIVFILIRRRK